MTSQPQNTTGTLPKNPVTEPNTGLLSDFGFDRLNTLQNPVQQNPIADSYAGLLSDFGLDRLAQENTGNDATSEGGVSSYAYSESSSDPSALYSSTPDFSDFNFADLRSDSTGTLYSDFSDIDTPVDVDNIFDRTPRNLTGERVNGLSNPIAGGLEGKTMQDANSDLLKQGGFDPDNFSPDFLSSPEVYTEISKKVNALPKGASDAKVKTEITNAVNELNLKHIQGQPLDLGKNLNSIDDLAPVITNIRESLPDSSSARIQLGALENRIKQGDNSSEVKADFINVLDTLSKEASQKNVDPALAGMKDAIDGLSQHMKAGLLTEVKDSVKQQMMEHYQHLGKAGAADSTTFSFDLSIPVATALNLGVSASQTLGFSTTNNLLVSQTNSTAAGVTFDVGLHNVVTGGVGAGISHTSELAHMGVGKMVDHNADNIFDQLVRTVGSSAGNPSGVKTVTDFNNIVSAQNNSRNHQDKLESDMQDAGWLSPNDSLATSTAHERPTSSLPFPGRDITTNANGNISAGNGAVSATYTTGESHTVAIAGEYVPMLESLVSTPELLKAKQDEYITGTEAAELILLDHKVETLTSEPLNAGNVVEHTTDVMDLRADLQDKMAENGALLEAYTAAARNRDDTVNNRSTSESLSALGRKILGRESKDMSGVEKHKLEHELGTKGRQETLDALVTIQASYLAQYEKLNESQLNQPITGAQLNNPSRAIDALDLAQPGSVNYKDAQTGVAIGHINEGFDTPNMFLTDSDRMKGHALREGEIESYTRTSQVDLSFPSSLGGLTASLQGSHSEVVNHVDVLRDGKVDNYSLSINGDLTSDTAIDAIASQVNGVVGTEGAAAVAEALTEFRDNADEYGGADANLSVNFEYKDDNLMYVRVNVTTDVSAGLGVDIPAIGGANVGVTSSHTEPVIENIGTTSTYYPQIHFNGLNLHEGDKISGPGDAFSDFAQEHASAFTDIIATLLDPSSVASQELDSRRNDVNGSTKGKSNDVITVDEALINLREISSNIGDLEGPGGADARSEFIKSPAFEEAINDLRTIFTTFASTARSEGFDDRQPVVTEHMNPSVAQALFGDFGKGTFR